MYEELMMDHRVMTRSLKLTKTLKANKNLLKSNVLSKYTDQQVTSLLKISLFHRHFSLTLSIKMNYLVSV